MLKSLLQQTEGVSTMLKYLIICMVFEILVIIYCSVMYTIMLFSAE